MAQISRDINTIDRALRLRRRAYMESLGLKGVYARYFMEIVRNPGISQDKLSQRLYYDKSNVARQVAFLEEKGYVRRESDKQDKRVLRLYPTQKLLEILPGLEAVTESWEQALLQDLTEAEQQTFAKLLTKVRATVRLED